MKVLAVVFLVFASAQALPKVKWMDPDSVAHRPVASNISPRMINGRPALEGEAPYQAGILVDHSRFCGGTLISTTVVLTTASCLVGMSQWEVHLGTLDMVGNSMGRIVMTATITRVHEDFDILNSANALGLIRLPEAVIASRNVRPIRLPSSQMDLADRTAVASGWGITMKSDSMVSPYLKVAYVTIMPDDECKQIYGKDRILDSMFCVNTRQNYMDPCFGDAGSPIALASADGEKTLVGVAIWGALQDCSVNFPAIVTKVDHYLDWLVAHYD